ncbi:c-Myc-binding protein-like [Brienomyrus brachyistius]|uniref:c-Myc-binding protein-like n=1 Tax=Brienomyrus brachyistius TaxID=42636 RepID=UPI0020B21E7C|nr:c-Myc-binding protein-like [Brienomyrus brachyistius]
MFPCSYRTCCIPMALHRVSESKREQFRRYLEKNNVLDSLTNVLVALCQDEDKPHDALHFVRQRLDMSRVASPESQTLSLELMELQRKHQHLLEENKDLRNRLLQYELAPEDSRG